MSGYGLLLRTVAASIRDADPGAAEALKRAAVDVEQFAADSRKLARVLAWYDDHKRTDGFYDYNLWGDLRSIAAAEPVSAPAESDEPSPTDYCECGHTRYAHAGVRCQGTRYEHVPGGTNAYPCRCKQFHWPAAVPGGNDRDAALEKLTDIATREWRDEGGRIAAAIARDGLRAAAVAGNEPTP